MKDSVYHAYFRSLFFIFENNQFHTKRCNQAIMHKRSMTHPKSKT